MGFGKNLATGWGKPEETIDCRKLKKNKKGVLKSHTPLTSSHDDVSKNKKFTEIKLTVLVVPSTRYRRFSPIFPQIDPAVACDKGGTT
jgi:hypothetical protein